MYWACAQLQPSREALALHFLELAGFTTYTPRIRISRRGARDVTQFLFPSYTFVGIELQWHTARWAPAVIRLVMSGGDEPAKVPAAVIDRIRSQERDGYVVLPNATLWLCPPDRDQFWTLIADELRQVAEPGEGVVCRVIASAFLRLFRGLDVPDEPNLLGKITRGAGRYEAKLDAIDAHRTRRERSDAR